MKNPDLYLGFVGAALKVQRAYRHINELKSVIESFGESEQEGLTLTHGPDGQVELSFASAGPKGRVIPLIIGDAVHNLRSAYDHLWSALARRENPAAKLYFPFHETRKNLVDALEKSLVKHAFPDVERLVLEDVRPYGDGDGNRLIWAITRYDNIDKHNILIPTLRVNNVSNLVLKAPGMEINFQNTSFHNLWGSFYRGTGPVEYEQKGPISLEALFPKGEVLEEQPVIPTLANMANASREVVDLFAETFLGSKF